MQKIDGNPNKLYEIESMKIFHKIFFFFLLFWFSSYQMQTEKKKHFSILLLIVKYWFQYWIFIHFCRKSNILLFLLGFCDFSVKHEKLEEKDIYKNMILIFKTRMRFELNKRSVKSSYVIHSYHILYHILNNFHNIFIKIYYREKGVLGGAFESQDNDQYLY